jgi:hypothetical protein
MWREAMGSEDPQTDGTSIDVSGRSHVLIAMANTAGSFVLIKLPLSFAVSAG